MFVTLHKCCRKLIRTTQLSSLQIEQSYLTPVSSKPPVQTLYFTAENEHFFNVGLCIYSMLYFSRLCEHNRWIVGRQWGERLFKISKVSSCCLVVSKTKHSKTKTEARSTRKLENEAPQLENETPHVVCV